MNFVNCTKNELVEEIYKLQFHVEGLETESSSKFEYYKNLEEHEWKCNILINSSNHPISFFDKCGNLLLVNIAGARMLNSTPKDLIGNSAYDIFPKYYKELQKRIFNVIEFDKICDYEDCLQLPSGSKWFWSNFQPVRDSRDSIIGVQVISHEITDRKIAEEKLSEKRQLIYATFSAINDGIITTDNHGKIKLVNKSAEKLTGWALHEIINTYVEDILEIVDEKTNVHLQTNIKKVLETGCARSSYKNRILISKDGSRRVISESCLPVFDSDGAVTGIVLVLSNITEKRRLENEVLKIMKLESLGTLAGGIAHDFNNILAGISGLLYLAKTNLEKNTETYSLVSKAEEASFSASRLANKLLVFAKGGKPLRHDIPTRPLIEEAIKYSLSGSGIDYDINMPDDLWKTNIDKNQIDQVLHTIISYAQKSTPDQGMIFVNAKNMTIEDDILDDRDMHVALNAGRYVKVVIEDQGGGVKKEEIEKLFDPYCSEGKLETGLELAASYSMLRKNDGLITVESEYDNGTKFLLYLPASTEQFIKKLKKLGNGQGKILIMDSDTLLRNTTGEILCLLGFDIDYAKNGIQAIEKYENALNSEDPIDVVILDLTVPGGMGGEETIRELITLDPYVKAIISSGYSNDRVLTHYKDYGFSGVVAKPYTVDELVSVLQGIIDN